MYGIYFLIYRQKHVAPFIVFKCCGLLENLERHFPHKGGKIYLLDGVKCLPSSLKLRLEMYYLQNCCTCM